MTTRWKSQARQFEVWSMSVALTKISYASKFNILSKSITLIMSNNNSDGTLANTANYCFVDTGAMRIETCKCLLFWAMFAKFILHKWVIQIFKFGHVCQKDCISVLNEICIITSKVCMCGFKRCQASDKVQWDLYCPCACL